MEFQFTKAQEDFRGEVQQFIARNWSPPPPTARAGDEETNAAGRAFEQRLAEKGWLTMAWPREYGGLGANHMDQMIFREETAYAGAPGSGGQGISMVGPCLMVHGNEEQKKEHLPKIASGEVHWAQGFSEPGSGSDLASLQTRAIRDGDDFVINGQKIWTSGAHDADWIHVLTRTDPDAPKHRGISYFLLDMRTPGVTVRPLINMLGDHEFNEVFFEDVRVPAQNMMGEENRGWYVGATLLDFERSGVNWSAQGRKTVERLTGYARETSGPKGRLIDDAGIRQGLAELRIGVEASRLLSYRVAWMQSANLIPNYEASMSKVFGSELGQRIANFGLKLLGLPGQNVDPADPNAPLKADIGRSYMRTVPGTIAAGTSEIQRNIIATRGLGLPRG
ncbi:MAG: acyl-CoA dehydrogenase family protein [Dehalococcoidia bacterium]|nr:acyl-CoA dehydrogenase family protein [Dehalococcoidia bacterium]MCA9853390.1 acyl-CoA dehydrogenase family protein [Dehalococcoidia bacterium]